MALLWVSFKGCVNVGIYQHFRAEEHPFIDQVLSWREMIERTYQSKLTDFLDPREQQIIEAIIGPNNDEIIFGFYGGTDDSERKRALIAPFYEELTTESYQLTLLEATFNEKFINIEHRDVMGAFLSLGIDRSKLGDIIVSQGIFQLVVAEEIAPYVIANLTSVKHANIRLEEKSFDDMLAYEQNWIQTDKVVSSLRLDVVIRAMYNVSRQEAVNLIIKKQVKVNFKIVEDVAFNLFAGDLISVRRKGRGKLVHIGGRTRKNNLRITTALLK